jgi:hypothetical protein
MGELADLLPLALLILCLIALWFLRKSRVAELSNFKLSDDEAQSLRAELLDYVKDNAFTPETEVGLRPFWKKYRMADGDKLLILAPLMQAKTLLEMQPLDPPVFDRVIRKASDYIFQPLPEKVVLRPQEWWRMAHGEKAITIIENQTNDMRQIRQVIRADGRGQVSIGVNQVGDRAKGEVSGNAWTLRQEGPTPADMKGLAGALRSDAARLGGGSSAEPVTRLAEDVQDAADEGATDRFDSLIAKVKEVMGLVNLGGGVMKETVEIIDKMSG